MFGCERDMVFFEAFMRVLNLDVMFKVTPSAGNNTNIYKYMCKYIFQGIKAVICDKNFRLHTTDMNDATALLRLCCVFTLCDRI